MRDVKLEAVPQLHMLPTHGHTDKDKKYNRSISDLSDPSSTPRNFEDSRKNALLYTHVIAFTLFELETITKSFRSDYILGEGGFGTVYKGYIDENVRVGLKSLPVAVKVLNKEGLQGHREWLVCQCLTGSLLMLLSLLLFTFMYLSFILLSSPAACYHRPKLIFSASLGIPIWWSWLDIVARMTTGYSFTSSCSGAALRITSFEVCNIFFLSFSLQISILLS